MSKSGVSLLRRYSLCLGLAATLLLSACDSSAGVALSSAGGPFRILATTGMIGDIAARIAGSHATVECLMGPGVDPHLYKTSESDVRRLENADLILYNGLNLEGKMGEIFEALSRSRRVVAVSKDIPAAEFRTPPEFKGHHDPHIWFDVKLWSSVVGPIRRELSSLDPAHAADYVKNAEAVAQDLSSLDAWVESHVALIPADRRILVTAHDAFGYFGRRYQVEVVALQGISTAAEFSVHDVERLTQRIVERKVPAVFIESSVPRRNIEAVQKACEAKGHKVSIGGELFSDAMGAAGTPEGTYRGMVEHNVKLIVQALR